MRRLLSACLLVLAPACTDATSTVHAGADAGTDVPGGASGDVPGNAPGDVPGDNGGSPVGDAPDAADALPPAPPHPAAAPLTRWVNPFVGTGGLGYGTGSAFPGPQVPFGMARPGPDTALPEGAPEFSHCAGYAYGDTLIQGFSHTRMHGTGIADYGMLGAMPTVGMSAAKTTQTGYASHFSHDRETASPGYYAVTLDDTAIRAELTATEHVALHRYTFPVGSDAVVLLDPGHALASGHVTAADVTIDTTASELSGHIHLMGSYSARVGGLDLYWLARFNRPFSHPGVWQGGTLYDGSTTRTGSNAGAYVHFDTRTSAVVTMAVGLSFTDLAHARMNLDAEAHTPDFDAVRHAAEARWESILGVVSLEGRSDDDFRTFYSALYHTLLMPTLASDADGTYLGFDHAVHHADGFRYYTDFSLWDTFRTFHPLMNLIEPGFQRDFLRSLLAQGQQQGFMPRWSIGSGDAHGMIGEPTAIVFADSYQRGVRDWDLRSVYSLLRSSAVISVPANPTAHLRQDLADYTSLGWVPSEDGDKSATVTLEYAYADAAMATLANALGETADRDLFVTRSHAWRNLLDPATDFLVGRHRDGSLVPLTSPVAWQGVYAEGDAWQYAFYVLHDLSGLAVATGGRTALLARLNSLFDQSQGRPAHSAFPQPYYWAGNEPDIQFPWIFAALDDPASTARWTRWILASQFGHGPDGIPGNDDGGTMSAWYVLGAMGLFPFAGADDYILGSPLFTRSTLHLPGGDFVITAPDSSTDTLYVSSARLGGMPLAHARVPHAALVHGGSLDLQMSSQPTTWAQP